MPPRVPSVVGPRFWSQDAVKIVSGSSYQNTFPMYWTAELAKLLFRLTNKAAYREQALRAVDYLLLFQAIWSPPYLSVKGFGSIGIGNGHTGWNDARSGIFAPGIVDFFFLTGDPVGAKFFELLEKRGIKGLGWFDNGYRSVFNRKRSVRTPEDMKGLKIRVMESPIMVDTINSMGGSATPMAYGELYTALQQGVLDGAENAPGNMLNDKFYEITKYYSLTNHFRPPGVVAISLKVWNRLNKEHQAVLLDEAKALQTYEIELTQKVQQDAIEQLKAKGVQINEVDFDAFLKAVKPVHDKFSAKFGPDLVKQVLDTR